MKSILPDQGNKVPQVRVGLGDIQALLSMLTGYLAYLRKAVLPTPRRETQLHTLEGLQRRLAALLTASRQDGGYPDLADAARDQGVGRGIEWVCAGSAHDDSGIEHAG